MPRRVAVEDDWEDDPDDDGEWQPDDESEDETLPCPHCEAPVYEGAEQCPACGWYITEEQAPPARKSWWIALGFVLGLVAACLLILG